MFVAVLIIALQSFLLSYTALPDSTVMLINLTQLENAELPMLVTLDGMVTLVKLLQRENA